MSVQKFILIQVGIMLGLSLAAIYPSQAFLPPGSLGFVIGGILLAGISGILAFVVSNNGLHANPNLFVSYVIGGMLIKMFLGLISVTIIALKFKPFATAYVLSYFFCYFIFTSFEVVTLIRNLRAEKQNGTQNSRENEASQ